MIASESIEIKGYGTKMTDNQLYNGCNSQDFIAVKGKHATFVAHTAGRYQRKRFRKAQVIQRIQQLCLL